MNWRNWYSQLTELLSVIILWLYHICTNIYEWQRRNIRNNNINCGKGELRANKKYIPRMKIPLAIVIKHITTLKGIERKSDWIEHVWQLFNFVSVSDINAYFKDFDIWFLSCWYGFTWGVPLIWFEIKQKTALTVQYCKYFRDINKGNLIAISSC